MRKVKFGPRWAKERRRRVPNIKIAEMHRIVWLFQVNSEGFRFSGRGHRDVGLGEVKEMVRMSRT